VASIIGRPVLSLQIRVDAEADRVERCGSLKTLPGETLTLARPDGCN
jgi:hypothetical protein